MKRVLFIAYYFPPLGGIGSIRLTNFALHLRDYGWDASVLTPRNGAYFRDATLTFPEERTIRTGSLELSRSGKRLLRTGGSDTEATSVEGVRAALKQFIRRYAYFPDAQIGWYPLAVVTAKRHVHRGDYDAVLSSSFPITAHLVARRLHRDLSLPWVAEFRDPWSAALPASAPWRCRAERLEYSIGREASAVATVSPSWARMFEHAWGREVHVIRNGHDGSATVSGAREEHQFSLGYLGTYYPESQDLGAIWAAVRSHNASDSSPVSTIKFVGELDPSLEQELTAHGLRDLVDVTGFLPHGQALAQISETTALLIAGPRRASGLMKGHVVAKLSEYLATDRPIIYVGDPGSDAAHLLSEYPGTYVVSTGDAASALMALRQARTATFQRDAASLSRHAITARLAGLLDQVSS